MFPKSINKLQQDIYHAKCIARDRSVPVFFLVKPFISGSVSMIANENRIFG